MGQMVTGILLGCEVPKGLDLHGEEPGGDFEGLLGRWENHAGRGARIDTAHDGDRHLMGRWVMVQHGEEREHPGAVDLDGRCVRLAEIEDSREYKAARNTWVRFAAWAKKHEGVTLPEPTLWIAPTEVA